MPINVLYLHHVDQLSGAEQSLKLLLRRLDRARVRPFFAGPAHGALSRELAAIGVPLLPVTFGRLREVSLVARATRRIVGLLREYRIDLVHANAPQTNVCAGVAGRLMGIPAIWHARNLVYAGMRDIDRMLAALPTRIICNSEAIRRRFAGSAGWNRSVTILNGVDTGEFHPGVERAPFRQELAIAANEVAVGIVGRIGLGKGHDDFVEAAIRLIAGGARAQFLIVGDPLFPEDAWRPDMLRRRVKEARADDRIRFTGFRRDVPAVMRGLDVLVLASHAEPCGRVLFEAMASGTAIVATDSGGTPEIVRDGREGLLVPPCDARALAEAIGRVIGDATLRATLGQAGIERTRSEFTIEQHVARTIDVYEEALGRRGSASASRR